MYDLYENSVRWQAEAFLENPAILKRFELTAALIPGDSRTLLDVGTGNGAFLHYLEAHPLVLRLFGMERAQTAMSSTVCQTPTIPGSIERLPFADRAVDVVTALEVIEHLPYDVYPTALDELARVARNTIIVSVPYREFWRPVRCPYCGCSFHRDYHMRRYDEAVMRHMFSGFRCEQTVLVGIPEYVFMPLVRRWRRWHHPYASFPGDTICPQCGYRREAEQPVHAAPAKSKIVKKIKRFIPLSNRPRWIIGLYRRIEGETSQPPGIG